MAEPLNQEIEGWLRMALFFDIVGLDLTRALAGPHAVMMLRAWLRAEGSVR